MMLLLILIYYITHSCMFLILTVYVPNFDGSFFIVNRKRNGQLDLVLYDFRARHPGNKNAGLSV